MASTKEGLFQTPTLSTAAMNPYRTDRIVPIQLPTDKYPGALIASEQSNCGGIPEMAAAASADKPESRWADPSQQWSRVSRAEPMRRLCLSAPSQPRAVPVGAAIRRYAGNAGSDRTQGIAAPAIRCVDLDGGWQRGTAFCGWRLCADGVVVTQTRRTDPAADFDGRESVSQMILSRQTSIRWCHRRGRKASNQGFCVFLPPSPGNLVPKPIITSPSILGSGLLSADLSGDGWPIWIPSDHWAEADCQPAWIDGQLPAADRAPRRPDRTGSGFQRLLPRTLTMTANWMSSMPR